jgi:hypothetical protein
MAASRTVAMLRRLGRIMAWGIGGFVIGSIVLVMLYQVLPPPGTPLMLLRWVEGYGIHKTWQLVPSRTSAGLGEHLSPP